MNGDYCSDLEVDKRYEIGYPIGQVHLISPYHEPEASGLQVASLAQPEKILAQPEKIAPKNTVHRTCGLRKSAFWLSLALVVVIVMGVTGISVAGCLAAKWKSEAKEK